MKINNVLRIVKKYSPEILMVTGTAGFVVTVVLTAKTANKAKRVQAETIDYIREEMCDEPTVKKAIFAVCKLGKVYLPIVALGASTLACFYGSNAINMKRTAELSSAYTILANTFDKYKEHAIKHIEDSEFTKNLLGDISEEETEETNKDVETTLFWEGVGDTRVYDRATGRKFMSTPAKIREAESTIVKRLANEMVVPLNDFYEELGLEDCSFIGEALGWDMDKALLDIDFRSNIDANGNPYLVLVYDTCLVNPHALSTRPFKYYE